MSTPILISTTRNLRRSTPRETPARNRQLVVLGIDPGSLVTGYGVVARSDGRLTLVASGTIVNSSDIPMPERLVCIYDALIGVIKKYQPDECSIESAFYGKNAQSALKLGHARGVAMLAAAHQKLPTAEYSPREVKKAVVGTGTASKQQVQFMVKSLLRSANTSMKLDASDALAIALCHLQRGGTPQRRNDTWASFVAAHPDRIRS